MSEWHDKYKKWHSINDTVGWGEFMDDPSYQPVMIKWLKDQEYNCGINSSYLGQHFHSIHLKSYLFWRLCGAKPIVVKQFGKEVTLDAEYYVKKLEKRLRLQLQKSKKDYMEEMVKKKGYYRSLVKMKKIVPLHKDPGQLNIIINFAHEERDRKPNEWGQKTIEWDLDFFKSMIHLSQKAQEQMEKDLMIHKLKVG